MAAIVARVLVDGVAQSCVPVTDRGLSYGDGLFETIRFRGADAPLWPRHMQRLSESCTRLRLPPLNPAVLLDEARTVVAGLPQSVVRMTLTRGSGARGYAPPPAPKLTRIVAGFELPLLKGDDYRYGIRMRMCQLRLAGQPLLAGMKHLNRLEQVLARAEWNDPAIAEGLLCDQHERVIGATMANLFAVIGGVLVTPALDLCGIAGVARAEILSVQPAAQVRELKLDELAGASELFLSSSVRGILPVRELEDRHYTVGPVTRALQRHWDGLGFSMEAE